MVDITFRLNGTLRRINLLSLSMLEKQEKEALMGGGETSNLRKRVKDKVPNYLCLRKPNISVQLLCSSRE